MSINTLIILCVSTIYTMAVGDLDIEVQSPVVSAAEAKVNETFQNLTAVQMGTAVSLTMDCTLVKSYVNIVHKMALDYNMFKYITAKIEALNEELKALPVNDQASVLDEVHLEIAALPPNVEGTAFIMFQTFTVDAPPSN